MGDDTSNGQPDWSLAGPDRRLNESLTGASDRRGGSDDRLRSELLERVDALRELVDQAHDDESWDRARRAARAIAWKVKWHLAE